MGKHSSAIFKGAKYIISNMDYNDEYYKQHPDLHEDDVEWKVEICRSFIDFVILKNKFEKQISILDIGGNGLFLAKISYYITSKYGIKVNKYSIDLDEKIIVIQRRNNIDIIEASKEDICQKTHFENKQFDLVLCNDIIEHVIDDRVALKELSRISKFVYFKQPLEKALLLTVLNFLTFGYVYKKLETDLGHINRYNRRVFDLMVNDFFIIDKYSFANCFAYLLRKECPSMKATHSIIRILYSVYSILGLILNKTSPELAAYIMSDFYLVIAKSKYEDS